MDNETKKACRIWNSEFNKNVLGNPDNAKVKASGASNAFLVGAQSFDLRDNGFSKIGLYPFEQDKGRGETKNRTGGYWQGLYDWLQYKKYGFNWKDEKERKGMAFALWKIGSKKGSWKHRFPTKQTKIYDQALFETLPSLIESVGNINVKATAYAL